MPCMSTISRVNDSKLWAPADRKIRSSGPMVRCLFPMVTVTRAYIDSTPKDNSSSHGVNQEMGQGNSTFLTGYFWTATTEFLLQIEKITDCRYSQRMAFFRISGPMSFVLPISSSMPRITFLYQKSENERVSFPGWNRIRQKPAAESVYLIQRVI